MPRKQYATKTLTLQSILQRLQHTDQDTYEKLDELLAMRGYLVYTDRYNVLKLRLPDNMRGLTAKEVRAVITAINTGTSFDQLMEERNDHES